MVFHEFGSAGTIDDAALRYALALLSLATALALGRGLGDFVPFGLGLLVLVVSSWYCGLGPSLVVAILSLIGLKFRFIPVHALEVAMPRTTLGMATVFCIYAAIVAMAEARRRESVALRRAQGELEDRVKQRTGDLDTANQSLRELTARLMQLQDEERRRIARELHDSVGQSLAALIMNLTTVNADIERLGHCAKTVNDSLALTQEMSKEVRTVSYLLHPPLLDEGGVASALQWYVEGFSERSKIKVELEVAEDFGRLPQEMETAIFRTVQECLTNIHRHSGSPVATICLARSSDKIRLKVEDRGAGIPAQKLEAVTAGVTPGVGIRGMRERMRQLGGTLEFQSNGSGTRVEAILPIAASSSRALVAIAAEF